MVDDRQIIEKLQVESVDIRIQQGSIYSNSKQVMADQSEHFIQLRQPGLVIEAIGEIVQAARP